MGNQLVHETGPGRPTRTFGRTGALGLSKAELDKRCQPSGLYPSCHWDEKAIRRLIGDGRLAARLKGSESRNTAGDQECPICFLQYTEVNITQCCKANICTECFLQIRPQKEKNCVCPFCNNSRLFVSVARKLNNAQLEVRQADEQRVIEARIRSRVEGQNGVESAPMTATDPNGFGSSLESDAILRRQRSPSMGAENESSLSDIQLLRQLSLTSQDRQALEEEMRAQHTHPLALQVEQEAEQRRIQNEIEYNRTHGSRAREVLLQSRALGGSGRRSRFSRMISEPALMSGRNNRRNWNEIVDRFERGGNGEVNSLDDLVVLEAAILLSMQEEESRRREQGTSSTNNNPFDASQHAQDGFPLVHEMMASRSGAGSLPPSGSRLPTPGYPAPRVRRGPLSPPALMDSATLLLRGVTEDEQMAMALALSMQESNKPSESNDGENNEGENDGNTGEVAHNEYAEESTGMAAVKTDPNAEEEESALEASGVEVSPKPPEASGVASLPESAVAQSAFASMPAIADDDGDDGDDDDDVQNRRRLLKPAVGKTTGDDVLVEADAPQLEDCVVDMPLEQPVLVMVDGDEVETAETET